MSRENKRKLIFLAIIGFFIFISVLLFELNIIIYWALVGVFHITHSKLLLGVLLAIFSGGFMFMLFIERYFTNTVIRFFYLLTSIWMGVLVYFFIVSVILVSAQSIFNISNIVGVGLFLIAVLVSLYGLFHGNKIVVKKIEVSLAGLPDWWKGKKIIWISDLHLGPIKRAKFAEKVTQILNSLSPEIVFIGGDLYDGSHRPDPFLIAKPLKDIRARLGTFFVTGNHEEFGNPGIFLSAVRNLDIKILDDRMVEIEGLQIIGVDYLNTSNKKRFKNILESMKINKEKPSILLKHEPSNLRVAERAGISFQISGHTHNGQQWPFNYLTKIMYRGFNYGLKKHGSMLTYVSSGVGGWGPPLRIGSDNEIVCITLV